MLCLSLRVRTSKPINSPSAAAYLPRYSIGVDEEQTRHASRASSHAGVRLALSLSSTDPRARKAYLRLDREAHPSGWAAGRIGFRSETEVGERLFAVAGVDDSGHLAVVDVVRVAPSVRILSEP